MQIDQPLLLTFAGVVGGVIALLFRELIKAKDTLAADQKETIKYQRQVIDHALSTAHRGVELATDRSGS